MPSKITRVQIDAKKIKEYVYKNGETYQALADAIGLDNASLGRYLKRGELPKTVYMSILMHYGIKDTKFFESEQVKIEEEKAEENRAIIALLASVNEKLDKLDYLNKNVCELVDIFKEFTELMKN